MFLLGLRLLFDLIVLKDHLYLKYLFDHLSLINLMYLKDHLYPINLIYLLNLINLKVLMFR